MPTFGKDTIRRFATNSSEMKKLAAHDYADLLQASELCCSMPTDYQLFPKCAIPAFEGLLPPKHDAIVLDLLFIMAQWHGLAKLRLHTDDTLAVLDKLTATLGAQQRKFKTQTCSAFETKELPREARARDKKQAKKNLVNAAGAAPRSESLAHKQPKNNLKEYKINTYKNHALGDYFDTIKRCGTVDSFSTELVRPQYQTDVT